MGQKDMAEKLLADYNDVFADIVNVLLFNGEQLITEDELEDTNIQSHYKADTKTLHEQERDIAKILKHKGLCISFLGLEHQTTVDENMPLRCISYDGAAYRSQLLAENKSRYPVITLVLYFGLTHWNKGHSISDLLKVSDEWQPYFNDYSANIFEIAFLSPQQVQMFQSDFRIVADYFVQKRTTNDYKPSTETIRHVDAVLKLLKILTNDDRFYSAIPNIANERRLTNMCNVLDRIEQKGILQGKIEGRLEGKIDVLVHTLHKTPEEASSILNLPLEEVLNVLTELEK